MTQQQIALLELALVARLGVVLLFEAHGISRFVVVCGYSNLRKGIHGLA